MNKPNILSNKFDQAKKTGKWYQKELKDEELLAAINDAFLHASDEWADVKETNFADQTFFVRTIDKGVSEWFVENKEGLPMEQILPLLDTHPTISCELARTKIPPRSGMDFFEIIGGKVYRTDTGIGHILSRNGDDVQGHIVTYISFHKVRDQKNEGDKRPTMDVTIKQIEYPELNGSPLPGFVNYRDLEGEAFAKEFERLAEGQENEATPNPETNTPIIGKEPTISSPKKTRFIGNAWNKIGNLFKGTTAIDEIEQAILDGAKHAIPLGRGREEALFSQSMCPNCETVKLEGGMQAEGYIRCTCPTCKRVYEQYAPYEAVYQITSEPKE